MPEYESKHYLFMHRKSLFEKSLNTLSGLISGIDIDKKLNQREISEVFHWLEKSEPIFTKPTFDELSSILKNALEDRVLEEEEKQDILYFCKSQLPEDSFYREGITYEIQQLHGLLYGILADGIITEKEITNLKKWLLSNEYLTGIYPFDELLSLSIAIMKDKKIDEDEQKILKVFFSQFIDLGKSKNISIDEIEELKKSITVPGICALDPVIEFEEKTFCFTGISRRAKRKDLQILVTSKSGIFTNSMSDRVDYLIVGADGNPCWVYSAYGRKIEDAINRRKLGHRVAIVNEIDFWDTIE